MPDTSIVLPVVTFVAISLTPCRQITNRCNAYYPLGLKPLNVRFFLSSHSTYRSEAVRFPSICVQLLEAFCPPKGSAFTGAQGRAPLLPCNNQNFMRTRSARLPRRAKRRNEHKGLRVTSYYPNT